MSVFKKVSLIFLCLILLVCAFVACDNSGSYTTGDTDHLTDDNAISKASTETSTETSATTSTEIFINGVLEETVEVFTEYHDPGVSCPDKYTLIVEGKVNSKFLGRQQIKYYINKSM